MEKNEGFCDVCGDVLPVDDCIVNVATGESECSDCRRERQETEDYKG